MALISSLLLGGHREAGQLLPMQISFRTELSLL